MVDILSSIGTHSDRPYSQQPVKQPGVTGKAEQDYARVSPPHRDEPVTCMRWDCSRMDVLSTGSETTTDNRI